MAEEYADEVVAEQTSVITLFNQDYLMVTQHPVYNPHTAGRYQQKRFRKAQCPIVERLSNSLMMHGRNNGKKLMTIRIVKHAFEIIHLLTDQNPLQVLVDAIINTGPREDSTRIGSQGTVRRQAVDVSPLRRVNQAIFLLTTGAREAAFRNVKTIAECLADELINAAKGSSNSYAIKKKDELERVAKAKAVEKKATKPTSSGGGKAKKKKWSKGKVKDKANNAVVFDKTTYDKLFKEAPTYKLITPSVLVDRLRINGSLARVAIRELESRGLIRLVSSHNSQLIYTRATKAEDAEEKPVAKDEE
ncbi:hypothetical protein PhCBS80983_g06030 [Powellomyces hirtus]|uniref:Small ribosomal subunit protein uS7 domain-containing protein n=1 Tax=Powellomyces hirtus TaxID=109895 RepID=A0A507DRH8_9FUNG|nr:hypothetical protein PhCBS80983_g06030 [Powellomyces hirtus]